VDDVADREKDCRRNQHGYPVDTCDMHGPLLMRGFKQRQRAVADS
jgi:hypothetical protein